MLEYVSVSSQSATEQADLARERKELSDNPAFELAMRPSIIQMTRLTPLSKLVRLTSRP